MNKLSAVLFLLFAGVGVVCAQDDDLVIYGDGPAVGETTPEPAASDDSVVAAADDDDVDTIEILGQKWVLLSASDDEAVYRLPGELAGEGFSMEFKHSRVAYPKHRDISAKVWTERFRRALEAESNGMVYESVYSSHEATVSKLKYPSSGLEGPSTVVCFAFVDGTTINLMSLTLVDGEFDDYLLKATIGKFQNQFLAAAQDMSAYDKGN